MTRRAYNISTLNIMTRANMQTVRLFKIAMSKRLSSRLCSNFSNEVIVGAIKIMSSAYNMIYNFINASFSLFHCPLPTEVASGQQEFTWVVAFKR